MGENQRKKLVNKKILVLVLLITIFVNHFIAPITQFAEEPQDTLAGVNNILVENMDAEYMFTNEVVEGNSEEIKEEPAIEVEEEKKEETEIVEDKPKNKEDKEFDLTSIEPAKAEDIEIKTKNDEYEINVFQTQFVSGAKEDANGNLVWTPSNSAKGHEFSFRVNYALSGLKEIPGGAIQITIPKSILRNREGKLDDYFLMSLPTSEEYEKLEEKTEFAYIETEENIVVYNPDEVKAGINGYFEVAYGTKSETFEYKDYDKDNTETVKDDGTASDPFNAIITVNVGEDTLANISEDEHVYIDTTAKIVSTQKRYPTIYRSFNTSWMKEKPENSDEYYYLIWEIRTYIQKDPTQKYNFTLNDVVKDLTEGLDGSDYELVGYKMSGEKYFSDKNTQENLTAEGYRYDYVLTRHKIETYKEIAYSLKNTVTAVVDPVDQVDSDSKATSSNTFSWDPGFTPPTGHFNLFKYGNSTWYSRFGYYWDYANYDLDKFQSKEMEELDGFKYYTETIGYAYPWTLKEGGSLENPEDYGVNPVKYETWDDSLYLEGDTEPMKAEDYYLDYLTYSVTNLSAEHDDFENKFITTSPKYEENETIKFYGKFNGSEEWTEIGKYNLSIKKLTKNDDYVKEITTSKIEFKDGAHCTGWKFETTNKHYYTYIVVTPYFVLTNSDYVLSKVENKDSIKVQNNVNTNITDYKGNTIFEKETSGIDYARVTYYDSEITKKVSAASNNVLEKTNTITWKVNAWETATSGSGKAEYIKQDSGIFYDLIPTGGEIDLDTVQVETEKGYLEENEYSYEVVSNYKNSGRTMLIVKIGEQAEHYTVYYSTVHSWDSIKDYGRNVLNPVAYETGNEKITNGYEDNGGNLSQSNKEMFTNLDEATDDKKFIYAEQSYNINAVTAAIAGLYKKVKNAEETTYTYETEVEPEGSYSYQLRYQNTFINTAKDLVFFDSLENFEIKDSETGKTTTSGWKGKLKSVDLKQLTKKGIDAQLYVSTIENLNLEQNNNIKDTKVWKKATKDTDLSKVTAIAIDMSKAADGSNYILPAGDSVSAVVYMEAPSEVTKEVEKNPYAYNNVYMKNTLIDILNGEQEYFIHQDYTKVKYHVVTDVNFYKVNEKNEDETIKGITFRLYGTSDYGTKIDEYAVSDKNGKVRFKDIEAGEYILQEYEATPDWVEDHTEHSVKITNTREVYINEKLVTKDVPCKITNKPRIHTDVEFVKKDLVTKGVIEGAKFKLSGTSKYGNEILMYATSKVDGIVKFENLEYGTYEMVEIETAEGYVLGDDKYRVVVDENGNYDIQKKFYKTEGNTIKYSHTDNIDDRGYASTNYANNLSEIDTVIIPEADMLDITVYYGMEGTAYDWVSVYDSLLTPSSSNYSSSLSGKLGGNLVSYNTANEKGYQNVCEKWQKTIPGNTVKFYFKSDSYGVYYGYYAVIKAIIIHYESVYNNGNYIIYNEPLHSIRVVKRDEYSDKPIQGAKFKLFGVSDYGNSYNKEIESTVAGFVDFTELEAGTYVLQETYVPEVTDDEGNTISYILDETKYAVEIKKDGTVTIEGIEQNENGNFVIYNKRNKGQITITKKWVDDKENSERQEPTIKISTEKPEQSKFVYFRDNSSYSPLYYINSDYRNKITGSFARNITLSEDEVVALGAVRLDREYNNPNAEYKIYGWIDGSGNCWWWSNAEVALMTDNSNMMFSGMSKVKSIDTTDINTSKVRKMGGMFSSCQELTELDVSSFDTSNVTDMSNMFYSCKKLTELDVSEFDTSKVTYMNDMFRNCPELTELDLSGFDTSKVTDMARMFYLCNGLIKLDVSSFDTSNVIDMEWMFSGSSKLTELDVSGFNTSKVTDMEYMFYGCSSLEELDVSGFDTSNVTNISSMFNDCQNLTSLNVSDWNTSNVISMMSMFNNCQNLTSLNVSNFDTSKVTSMYDMFNNCQNLTSLDVAGFDTSKVTYMSSMFNNCKNLTAIDVNGFDTSNVRDMQSMFNNCQNLKELDVSGFDTSNVTNMQSMFNNCQNLIVLDVSGFDTSNVTNMQSIFNNCQNLIELDLSKWNTNTVINMKSLFYNCSKLKTIYATEKFDTVLVTDSESMFVDCRVLVGENGTTYNSSYTNKTYARIDKEGEPGYFTYKFNGEIGETDKTTYQYIRETRSALSSIDINYKNKITGSFARNISLNEDEVVELGATRIDREYNNPNATYKIYGWIDSEGNCWWWSNAEKILMTDDSKAMFSSMNIIKSIDMTDINTRKVTNMSYMFGNCQRLVNLNVSRLDTSNVTNMSQMFASCKMLPKLDVSRFDTSSVITMSGMFRECNNLTQLDVSGFDTSSVTSMESMFYYCNKLETLDLSSFDTSNVTNMIAMLRECHKLNTIYVSENFKTINVTSSGAMFYLTTALVGGNGTTHNYSYTDKTYARIDKEGQPGYFTDIASKVSALNNEDITKEFAANENKEIVNKNTIKEMNSLKTNNFATSEIVPLAEEDESVTSEVLTYSTADKNYDDEGNEVTWVKNGDTWTYTFYVDDPNATWYVWEESMEGYKTNYTQYNTGEVENQHATIINIKDDTYTSVEYGENRARYGNLKITKILIDRNGNITLTKEDDDTEFTFVVTLTAKEGQEALISGIQVFGDYVFKDGVGKIKLRTGEEATITGIPAGTTYEVIEEKIGDYSVFEGATGTIPQNQTRSIYAYNYININEETTTNITLTKKVTGNYEKEEDFKFEISFNSLKPNAKYNLSNGMSFVSDKDGNADVSVTLKNEESITVQNIPVGSKYKVYEHAGDYISTYMITDANGLGLINNSADSNTKENVALSTKLEIADEGEDVTIVFINDKNVKQNLKLTKKVTSEDDKNSYMFTVQFANLEPNSTFNSTVGKVKSDSQGKAEIVIYLAGGDEAEFYNIPIGTTYKITEEASGAIASYTITDKNAENKIVSESGSNTVNKMALSTQEETINEDEEAVVTFINDIVNQEEDCVEVSLGATKTVLDISGKVLDNCKETFTFEITPENEENPMPENKEIKIKGNGTESFGEIKFTKTGTYKYKVTEKIGKLDYYDYDKTEYEITYEVTNEKGLLEVEKTIKKDGFIADAITFTNKISKVDVKIEKIDEKGELLKGATLQIKDEKGNIVDEWETTKETHTTKLPVGKYTLHEEKAPKGYKIAKDIEFTVNENGETVVNEEILEKIIMKDTKIKEEIGNTDEDNKEEISKPDDNNKDEENNKADSANKPGVNVGTGDNIVYYFIAIIAAGIIMIIAVKKNKTIK